MTKKYIPLSALKLGNAARVWELTMGGSIRRRMLDLGLVRGTRIEAINRSPFGDPVAYSFRGAIIALRSEEASGIIVEM
ncbi:MAG TPA: FeoA family protein [Clostridia bacterium]|nr:FeoA family protein [Clostridia bacterium]